MPIQMNNSSQSLISFFFLFLLINSIIYSQTWTGGGDGVNWTDPANWDTGVPSQIGDAAIPTGMTATIGTGELVDWTTGDLIGGGTLVNDGEINMTTGANKIINGATTIINNNLFSVKDGTLFFSDGHLINEDIIVFTADNDNISVTGIGQHDLTNNGTIIKDGGTGISTISINLINNGTLYALTGEMRLSASGRYNSGTNLLTANGAILSFHAGIHLLDGNIIGNSDGEIEMRTTIDIANTATLDIENKGIECTDCTFTGGGSLSFLDKLSLTTGANKILSEATEIIITDTMEVNDGSFFISDGHVINDGIILFTADNDNISITGSGSHDLTNNGSIIKDGGTDVSNIFVNIINNGIIHTVTGELRLNGTGMYNTGTNLLTSPNTILAFQAGTHTLNGNIIGNSDGEVEMRTIMEIQNTATIDIQNHGIECTDCTFTGGGTLNFIDKLSFTTGANKIINGMTDITITDTMEVNNGSIFISSGHLINDGVIVFTADNDNISITGVGPHDFTNNGRIVKDGGTARTIIAADFKNFGEVIAKTGIFDLNTGLFSPVEHAIYSGEGEIDLLNIPVADIASGMMVPGIGFFGDGLFDAGILTIDGDIDTSRFKLDIYGAPTTAGTDFDQTIFNDDISVVDSIDIDLWYRPIIGDVYDVVLADNIMTCALPDTINTFYNGCDHRFEVICQSDKIQLKYVGIALSIDHDALMALYNSTDGPNWTDNTNWGSGCPCDTQNPWANVECSLGRVTKLFLANNNLTGAIPADIGQLTQLRTLNLSGNNITGSIPSSIGNLSELEVFQASNNDLTGAIPEQITQCTELEDIRLQNNNLAGPLPTNLGNLSKLTGLLLHDNSITGSIPASIGNLPVLTNLFLYNNQLSGAIPSTVGNLSSLLQLRLSGNMLTGNIPPEIGMLDNMTLLWLQSNQLGGGIPLQIMDCSSLTTFLSAQNPNMDGCYDTRLQLLDSQWATSAHVSISAGTQMANWDNFIANGSGTCCLATINETCNSGPCGFFDGAFWQAEGDVVYSGDHKVDNGIIITLNSGSSVELESSFEVDAGAELNIPMTGCDQDIIPGGSSNDMGIMDIDGNVYDTVQIGTQTWFAQNLKTSKLQSSKQIAEVTNGTQWSTTTIAAFSWYNNNEGNDAIHGKLYNWYAVNTQELCPIGWRVASEEDWDELIAFIGGSNKAEQLRVGGSTGFDAEYSGRRSHTDGSFLNLEQTTWFWTSTFDLTRPIWYSVSSFDTIIRSATAPQQTGYSVRCIKE
jgi:uncharacterized protein (TIGR02145 family)